MVAAFPLGKLIYLGIRQISKPISRQLQRVAYRSPFFRKYVCAPPAQVLHYLENFVKMRLMGVSGPTEVRALKEEKAAELGAEIIGEMFIFSTAASFLVYEYYRSVKKEQQRDDTQDSDIDLLQKTLKRVSSEVIEVKERLHQLEQSISASTSTSTAKPTPVKTQKS